MAVLFCQLYLDSLLLLTCAVLSRFSCVARLCDPMDCSPSGSFVHGILQAIILEWIAASSSRGSARPRNGTFLSCGSCIAGEFFTAEPTHYLHKDQFFYSFFPFLSSQIETYCFQKTICILFPHSCYRLYFTCRSTTY